MVERNQLKNLMVELVGHSKIMIVIFFEVTSLNLSTEFYIKLYYSKLVMVELVVRPKLI